MSSAQLRRLHYPEIRNPIVLYLMLKRPEQVSPFYHATHAFSIWLLCICVTILFGPLAFNLSIRNGALFPKYAAILRLVEQALWRCHFSQNELVQVPLM